MNGDGHPVRAVSVDELGRYMRAMLAAAGCSEENAGVAAEGFLAADLRGVGLQGLDHMPTLLDALRDGRVDGLARPRVAGESAGAVLIDGGGGPGQAAAMLAVECAVERARRNGSCAAAVTNSFDLFMLGHYTERIALAGLAGFGFSDAPPMVRPHGGTERRLGTNPVSIAIPVDGDPLVLDFSTSALSASRVRQAGYHGETVPEAEGVDSAGHPSADPAAVREGAIGPLAGHKGFGLGLCVALLAGPLTGSDTGRALLARGTARKGHLFLAVDPAHFGDLDAFRAAASAYLAEVKECTRVDGTTAIRVPGERAAAARRRALDTGRVAVYESVWTRMAEIADSLGVEVPATETQPAPSGSRGSRTDAP